MSNEVLVLILKIVQNKQEKSKNKKTFYTSCVEREKGRKITKGECKCHGEKRNNNQKKI